MCLLFDTYVAGCKEYMAHHGGNGGCSAPPSMWMVHLGVQTYFVHTILLHHVGEGGKRVRVWTVVLWRVDMGGYGDREPEDPYRCTEYSILCVLYSMINA